MATLSTAAGLSTAQIDRYYQDGFIPAFTIIPPEDMAIVRKRIEDEVLSSDGPNPNSRLHCRHLDHEFLRELCRSPNLIAAASQLMGTDLQVWSTNFWLKEPGGTAVPWHQDIDYWPLNPPLNLTMWIAIDSVDEENSCVQVIPGSHRRSYEHKSVSGQMLGKEAQFDPAQEPDPVLLQLKPGQAAIFNERLLHYSTPNSSQRRRLGFGVRIIPPFVAVDHDEPPLFEGHQVMHLHGADPFARNRVLNG